ncbi:hypothetical protein V8J88_20320 [Massilia sp. W12]|uniref:hypothetical protein n=1 Tax=Massilia sp. W12 TaxID=3126507 RepID=UPI0030D3D7DD
MQLDAHSLLQLWEDGAALDLSMRKLLLLQSAWPLPAPLEWARQTCGRVDWHLLYLRCQWFGAGFDAVTACPACEEQLESSFSAEQICPPGWQLAQLAQGAQVMPHDVMLQGQWQGQEWRMRAPQAADLPAATGLDGVALLQACLPPELAHLAQQADWRAAAQEALLEADPLAEISIGLHCPACGHAWQRELEIGAWLWQDLTRWAHALLQQVHQLALAYGWSEHSILALSARRRALYLQMLGC